MDEPKTSAFRPGRAGLAKVLGSLEAVLMEVVWAADGPVTAREAKSESCTEAKYVTVATVLNNLTKKGVLRRTRLGKMFVFEPIKTREQFVGSMSDEIVRGLFDLSPRIAVNSFIGSLDGLAPAEFAELRRELRVYMEQQHSGGEDDE